MRLLALVMAFMALTAHAPGPADAWCRSSTIAKVRQVALAESHAVGRSKAVAALAAYDRLKPALDAGCLESTRLDSPSARPMNQDAIAYAWLLNDASAYLIAADARDDSPQDESGSPACLSVLQPLLGDDMRPRPGVPRNLGAAIAANVLQCGTRCVTPSCKPTNVSIWSAYRSESAAYTRHPACPYDARLVQLNDGICVGFDAGAFATSHTYDEAGKLTCDDQSSTSATRCPAMLVLTRDHGRNTTRRFPPAEHSALSDPSTACTVRSTGVDAGGTHFALMGEGRDCFGGTAYSLIEEIYVLRDVQPVLVRKNSADF
ncbi:hypothetical protein D1006_09340 [Burkholderia stabilis]|uniref:Uncharacterized protein n=1 Tax=Burkholderia stabilis TaxID=95485 RepID=A0A4Q2AU33_9BURK|nr:hypothetical protein [Burkholderia stabilis]RXV72521.1 hypothetical protein D1006_09340 [Burkholderia stabilis]